MSRLEQCYRDPTLEEPSEDYYVVRLPWDSLVVTRWTASRIVAALCEYDASEWIRFDTVNGSVVHVRLYSVVYVRESTRAQRDAERRFWDARDQEEPKQEEEKPASSDEQ